MTPRENGSALEPPTVASSSRTARSPRGVLSSAVSLLTWRSAPTADSMTSRRLPARSLSADSWNSREGLSSSLQHTAAHLLAQVSGAGVSCTFLCPICMENIREEERVVFSECANVEHGCCQECMSHYLRVLIADGRVSSIACPQSKECGASAAIEEVRQLCDNATLEKYDRFRQMRQDPTLRQCPSCTVLCKPARDEEGGAVAEMHCQACGSDFCYYHSNAHPGRPCEEYQREVAKLERASERTAMRGTKLCPSCKMATDKISGCNHMTCANCQCDWCWVCGVVLENISWHFNPGNPSGCQQFQDSDTTSSFLFKALRCCMAPVAALSILLFFVLSLGILFWGPVLFALIGPCVKCRSSTVCTAAAICTFLPFLVWQCAWMIVALVLQCFIIPCGARSEHLFFLLQVPFASVAAFVEGWA